MASWPSTLPDLRMEGYEEARTEGVVRTQMDAGPEFSRRRYTAVPTNVKGSLALTKAQVSTLDTFYFTTLDGGADEFDWTHPRTGSSVSMRFLSPPRYRNRSGVWIAQVELEILP